MKNATDDREGDRTGGHSEPVRESMLPFAACTADFLLWQLSDSALPTGGFAHSSGLEAAWQHGEVANRTELVSFVETSLVQLGRAMLPFISAAFDEPERLDEIDALCDAFTTNHVANRASRQQGRALLAVAKRAFQVEMASPRFAHFPPVFGAALRRLGMPRETALRLFCFNHLRSLMAAAVRLNLIGPMEAQSLQHRLSTSAEAVRCRCETLTLEDIAQTSPLMDLWQGTQDRLYSRLFQS